MSTLTIASTEPLVFTPAETPAAAEPVRVVDASTRGSHLLYRQPREMRTYVLAGDSLKQVYALHPRAPKVGERAFFNRQGVAMRGTIKGYAERYFDNYQTMQMIALLDLDDGKEASTHYRNVLPETNVRATVETVAAKLAEDQHVTGFAAAMMVALEKAGPEALTAPVPVPVPVPTTAEVSATVSTETTANTDPVVAATDCHTPIEIPPAGGRSTARAARAARQSARAAKKRLTASAATCDNSATASVAESAAAPTGNQENTMTITAKRTAKQATKQASNGVTVAAKVPATKRSAARAAEWVETEVASTQRAAKLASKSKAKATKTKAEPAAKAKPAKPSRTVKAAAAATNAFVERQRVMVRYSDGADYAAKVVKPGSTHTTIDWADGSGTAKVANSKITIKASKPKPAAKSKVKAKPAQVEIIEFKRGAAVSAKADDGKYYPAKFVATMKRGGYKVNWVDGEYDEVVTAVRLRTVAKRPAKVADKPAAKTKRVVAKAKPGKVIKAKAKRAS